MNPVIIEKAKKIRMVLLDVDGVMTNGQVFLMPDGEEVKQFFIQDGFGIVCAMSAGIRIGIISGRSSTSLKKRCEELGIDDLYMGAMEKLPVLDEVVARHQLRDEEIAYIGDDLPDLPVLQRIGLSAAPQNAHPYVQSRVDLILKKNGGEGAVREFLDFLLLSQEKEAIILSKFISKTVP